MMATSKFLVCIIVLETAFLFIREWDNKRQLQSNKYTCQYYEENNPLVMALEYESPLTKFEKLVKANMSWLKYRQQYSFPDKDSTMSILSRCATLSLTNHIRILLKYGADSDEAIQWLNKYGSEDAARLVENMKKEQQLTSQ